MDKNRKLARLASIDNSVLGKVAGGKGLDLSDSWAFNNLSTWYCYDSVWDAAWRAGSKMGGNHADAWDDAAWSAANDAANDMWNHGWPCIHYGW